MTRRRRPRTGASPDDPPFDPAVAISSRASIPHGTGGWAAQRGRIPRRASACGSLSARCPGSMLHGGLLRASRRACCCCCPSVLWNSPRMRAKLRVIKLPSPTDEFARFSIASSASPGLHSSKVPTRRRRSRSRSGARWGFRLSGRGRGGGECVRGRGSGAVDDARPEELRHCAGSSPELSQEGLVPLPLCQLRRRCAASRSARKDYGRVSMICRMT